jgi:magnesium-transporting ATPase (P-type)
MSDTTNPYESFQSESEARKSSESADSKESFAPITESMIASIKQSSSWIRFLAIYGFISVGLVIVPMALFSLLSPFIGGMLLNELDIGMMNPILFSVAMIFSTIAIGAICIFPLIFLHNIGSKMRAFVQTNNATALELAFKNNKSFWKFCGILTIVSLALIPVSLIILGVLYVRNF